MLTGGEKSFDILMGSGHIILEKYVTEKKEKNLKHFEGIPCRKEYFKVTKVSLHTLCYTTKLIDAL